MSIAALIGDGERAEGFEEWAKTTMESMFSKGELADTPEKERKRYESRLRIMKIMSMAVIENCRIEAKNGGDFAEVMLDIMEAMGNSAMSMIFQSVKPEGVQDAMNPLAKHFVEAMANYYNLVRNPNGPKEA